MERVQKSTSVKSKETHESKQIRGFTRCLQIWFEREFRKDTQSSHIFQKLTTMFSGKDISLYPKIFKDLLAWNFSWFAHQDLPDVKHDISKTKIWNLFRTYDRKMIQSRLTSSKRLTRKLTTLWSLLQCKSIAEKVPDSFIREALLKHRETVSRNPEMVSDELKSEIRQFIRPFVEETVRCYRRNPKTLLPNKHSCIESTRKNGGNRGYYLHNGPNGASLFSSSINRTFNKSDRFDPVVIHIEGPAGCGKSTATRKICQMIEKRFGIQSNRFDGMGREVYSRSGATDHWDGYQRQLITVIDDFGFEGSQSASSTGGRQTTFGELIQMCSDVDFVLPMAELKNKGMKFTSKFVILSSNHGRNNCGTIDGTDHVAFCRRISPTWLMDRQRRFKKVVCDTTNLEMNQVKSNSYAVPDWTFEDDDDSYRRYDVEDIVNYAISKYDERYDHYQTFGNPEGCFNWKQVICEEEGSNLSIRLKANPPKDENPVRVSVVQDPLKARIITIPSADTFCLKTVQKAMFNALKRWNCFEPCWHPEYSMEQLRWEKGNLLLSGDYTSATDGLNFFVSQIVIEELAHQFKKVDPKFANWILYEGGKHLVHYPKNHGIDPVFQINGQLMGSLLSFPILTILNAFTLCKATGTSLETVKGLFHGDDIAAALRNREEFEKWKAIAGQIGLELSIGKNYLSDRFLSIDSQLFVRNLRTNRLEKQKTGKLKLIYRKRSKNLTVFNAMEQGFSIDLIKRYAGDLLKKTPRSLRIPVSHGGLANEWSIDPKDASLHEKLCYLAQVELKSGVKDIAPGLVQVDRRTAEMLSLTEVKSVTVDDEGDDEVDFEERLRNKISRIRRRLRLSRDFAHYVKIMNLGLQGSLDDYFPTTVRRDSRSKDSLFVAQAAVLGIHTMKIKDPKIVTRGSGIDKDDRRFFSSYIGPNTKSNCKLRYQPDLKNKSSRLSKVDRREYEILESIEE